MNSEAPGSYDRCVRILDISNEPSIGMFLEMLRSMTSGNNSKDMLTQFIRRYSRARPIDAWVGCKPEDGKPGHYRVMYAIASKEALEGTATHTRDVRPEALARLPLAQGGFFAQMMADTSPKMVYDIPDVTDVRAGPIVRGMRACMVLPIFKGDDVFEWTFAFSNVPEGVIQPRDVGQAMLTANLLGAANRSVDMVAEIGRLNNALREQLDGIARVQQSLLPARIPDIPSVDIATSYLTSDEAGGDYYDFFRLPGGRWGMLIADVSGHGPAAATVMAMLHAILHCYEPDTTQGPDPSAIMAFANRRLLASNLDGMFVTAFFSVLDPLTGEFSFCNCGHNPPRVKVGGSGDVIALDRGGASIPLGILEDVGFETERITLGVGDTVVLYTDGITEAFSPDEEMFGTQRLDQALVGCSGRPDCVVESIHKALFVHRQEATRDDDQTIVALQYHGLCAVQNGPPTAAS